MTLNLRFYFYSLDCQNVFALICRSHYETKERLYSFEITSEDVEKVAFLKTLCRLMANITCRADAVSTNHKFLIKIKRCSNNKTV